MFSKILQTYKIVVSLHFTNYVENIFRSGEYLTIFIANLENTDEPEFSMDRLRTIFHRF